LHLNLVHDDPLPLDHHQRRPWLEVVRILGVASTRSSHSSFDDGEVRLKDTARKRRQNQNVSPSCCREVDRKEAGPLVRGDDDVRSLLFQIQPELLFSRQTIVIRFLFVRERDRDTSEGRSLLLVGRLFGFLLHSASREEPRHRWSDADKLQRKDRRREETGRSYGFLACRGSEG
jgi:hypothetical protein